MAEGIVRDIVESGLELRVWADANGIERGEGTLAVIDELLDNPKLASEVAEDRNPKMAAFASDAVDWRSHRFLAAFVALYALANKPDYVIAAKAIRSTGALLGGLSKPEKINKNLICSLFSTVVEGERRFSCGNLTRYFAVVAVRAGFCADDAFMNWVEANAALLCEGIPNRATRWIAEALECEGYPSFDLAKAWGGDAFHVRKMYFDTDSRFCRDLLRASVSDGEKKAVVQTLLDPFFQEFEASIGFAPSSLDDFTVEAFSRQVDWFYGKSNPYDPSSATRYLRRFWLHICSLLPSDQRQFSVETGLTPLVLHHHTLFKYWKAGFRAVVRNPLDSPPENPRWFLIPSDDEMAKTNMKPEPWVVDLSYPVPELERLLVEWIWFECENVAGVRRLPNLFKGYMPLLELDGNTWKATSASAIRFLAEKEQVMDRSGIRHVKGWLRSFLRYAQEKGAIVVEPSCFMLLSVSEKSRRWEPDSDKAVPADNLKRVLDYLNEKSAEDFFAELMFAALCTQSLTPLRIGDILNLKRDDLITGPVGTTESVSVSTKMDGYDRRTVQVPRSVGELLDAVALMTSELAERALPEVADYIFLYQGHARDAVKKIRVYELTRRIRDVCDELGIDRFTPRNIRRRYETEVVTQGVRKNISRLALKPLTGHSSLSVTERYYVRDGIREYLQAVHGIEIGKPPIKGEVTKAAPLEMDRDACMVEGGAGYCRNERCNIPGTVTCLMCSGFLTEPGCIPEMEEAVASINGRMASCGGNQHERDHLLSVKRLYLGYLAIMYEMKEEDDGK